MKSLLKIGMHLAARLVTLPLGLLAGFGRVRPLYLMGAHAVALVPGLVGDYLRVAYYCWTLEAASAESRIEFGSFFAHARARLGPGVYIGPYTVLGQVDLAAGCQIASGVQILSGRRQHSQLQEGGVGGAEGGLFETVKIGERSWIGAGAVVMADVGAGATVGAGAVVVKPVGAGVVAVGNPARAIEKKV